MTTAIDDEMYALDIREKIAHIDLMLAQHDRARQEMRFAPWVVVISGFTAGAAFLPPRSPSRNSYSKDNLCSLKNNSKKEKEK